MESIIAFIFAHRKGILAVVAALILLIIILFLTTSLFIVSQRKLNQRKSVDLLCCPASNKQKKKESNNNTLEETADNPYAVDEAQFSEDISERNRDQERVDDFGLREPNSLLESNITISESLFRQAGNRSLFDDLIFDNGPLSQSDSCTEISCDDSWSDIQDEPTDDGTGHSRSLEFCKEFNYSSEGDGRPVNRNPTIQIDKVQFRMAAPAKLKLGKITLVKLMMYLKDDYSKADYETSKIAKKVLENSSGIVEAQRGVKVQFYLQSPDVMLTNTSAELLWNGEYLSHDFELCLPTDYTKEQVRLRARACQGDAVLADFKLVLEVKAKKTQFVPMEKSKFITAFASYAHEDEDPVLARIQGILAARPDMDLFFDHYSLRSGEHWEPRIFHEIDVRDLFYLFWSRNAEKSKWVQKEYQYALNVKGENFIHPVPLEPAELCKPPKGLEQFHFNDWTLLFAAGKQAIKKNIKDEMFERV